MKALLALASSLWGALIAPVPAPETVKPYSSIYLIRCGMATGTAFQIAPGRLITAAHVTVNGPCSINGVPVATVIEDRAVDLSELAGDPGKVYLPISCKRARRGGAYRSIGYAGGRYRIDARVVATGLKFIPDYLPGVQGAAMFYGNTIPGMSGGPMIREGEKAVTHIINAGAPMVHSVAGRALADTHVCKGKRK